MRHKINWVSLHPPRQQDTIISKHNPLRNISSSYKGTADWGTFIYCCFGFFLVIVFSKQLNWKHSSTLNHLHNFRARPIRSKRRWAFHGGHSCWVLCIIWFHVSENSKQLFYSHSNRATRSLKHHTNLCSPKKRTQRFFETFFLSLFYDNEPLLGLSWYQIIMRISNSQYDMMAVF